MSGATPVAGLKHHATVVERELVGGHHVFAATAQHRRLVSYNISFL
jgi:hypothetical protein